MQSDKLKTRLHSVAAKRECRPLMAEKSTCRLWIIPLILLIALAAERFAFPSDLMDNEQQRQAAYVMDAVQNHRWIFQLDQAEEIASKPPLFTWLAAGATELFGRPEPWALRSISFLATAAATALVFSLTRKRLGDRAAAFASMAYLLCPEIEKQIGLQRMDVLLPLTTGLGAWAVLRAWETGKGWTLFWLAAAASTLAKTPAAVLVSAAGLLAVWWENRSGNPLRLRGRIVSGFALFLVITLGWYWAAGQSLGSSAVYQKLIAEEFLSQSLQPRGHIFPGEIFYQAPALFLYLLLPWTIPMCFALLRIFTHPESDPARRRFRRFVACWLLAGMAPFCLATHVRADLVMPLYVPAAILAGEEVAIWTRYLSSRRLAALGSAIAILTLGALTTARYFFENKNGYISQTTAVAQLADDIRTKVGADFPLTHVDDPFALCVDLNTMRPLYYGAEREQTGFFDPSLEIRYDYAAAGRLLASDAAVYECVVNVDELRRHLPPGTPFFDLAGNFVMHLVSNRPRLADADAIAFGDGTLKIELRGLHLVHASGNDFLFSGGGSVQFENMGSQSRTFHAVIESPSGNKSQSPTLNAGAAWNWTVPQQNPMPIPGKAGG
jgi:4-amino-4-deoxy-L-arabinose transferase-like glycosyltransferase